MTKAMKVYKTPTIQETISTRKAHSKASKAENLINDSERTQNGMLVPYRKNGKLKYLLIQTSNNNII